MKLVALALLACACSNAAPSTFVGKPCGVSGPTQCGGGTTCLAQQTVMIAADAGPLGCSAETQVCTIRCASDNDCATALGAGFRCETRCSTVAPNQCVAD